MRIEIEIPKEFECDYTSDRFSDFFSRAIIDIDTKLGMCGRYEVETALMLRTAFHTSKVAYDVEAKVAELEKSEKRLMLRNGNMGKTFYIPVNTAISIVRGKE